MILDEQTVAEDAPRHVWESHEELRARCEGLHALVLEAVSTVGTDDYTARVIAVLRSPEHAADYLARRGEYVDRPMRRAVPKHRRGGRR